VIREALAAADGVKQDAATRLGIQPSNLSRLMKTLGMREEDD
jgi:transcriptional regulator with GAF, ATPase, and Fis domain